MTGLDALRCTKLLPDQHGDRTELVAAMRADELDAGGDAGRRAWRRILAAINKLARTVRRPDEPLQ